MLLPTPPIVLSLLMTLTTFSGRVGAQTEAVKADDATHTETRRILAVLEADEQPGNAWWYGWAGFYAGMLITQSVGSHYIGDKVPGDYFEYDGFRANLAVGALGSSLGLLSVVLIPFPATSAASELREAPGRTPAERLKRLHFARRLLERTARSERFAKSIWVHIASTLVPVGLGAILYLKYDRFGSGLFTFVGGSAIGQVRIATVPTSAMREVEARRRGSAMTLTPPRFAWAIAPHPGGAALRLTF
ncbi:MAG: hypothetical protein HRU17_02820 [Polyangiaceae bacterium]|nr:hypothetical protein [Polyangiaceae bacterium]